MMKTILVILIFGFLLLINAGNALGIDHDVRPLAMRMALEKDNYSMIG